MTHDQLKKAAGEAAIKFVEASTIIGVGTGTTVNYFIDALHDVKNKIDAAVSSSKSTTEHLRRIGIEVIDLNCTDDISVYIDGADEINNSLQMIKGGGGALTSEKIVASVAKKFICIADESKHVSMLGKFPVAIEVIPVARSFVAREIVKLGGTPIYREHFITDHGNVILDVHNLKILEPKKLERILNNIVGVVENGVFASRPADTLLLADKSQVKEIELRTK